LGDPIFLRTYEIYFILDENPLRAAQQKLNHLLSQQDAIRRHIEQYAQAFQHLTYARDALTPLPLGSRIRASIRQQVHQQFLARLGYKLHLSEICSRNAYKLQIL
jgi:hypothetical protein